MDEKLLSEICRQVYQQFSILQDTIPEIRSQPGDSNLLIFSSSGLSEDGHPIPFIVRVLVNKDGKIIKTTTSR